MRERTRSRRHAAVIAMLVAVVLGAGLVAHGVHHIGDFLEDDTLISLRYAQRLLHGHGLTWTDGERVEGYSNLSWVLGSAALGALGLDLIVAVRLLAVLSLLVTLLALAAFARRLGADWSGLALATLVLGATASVAVWIVGALEQPLVIACLAVGLWALAELEARELALRPWGWVAAGAFSVLVLTRPDAPLFVALLVLCFPVLFGWGRWKAQLRVAGLVAGVPALATLGQLAFRLAYYGEWVPNTALIKATVSEGRLRGGVDYVLSGLETEWLLVGAAAVGLALAFVVPRTRRWAATLLVVSLGWLAYVVAIGGDHFPAWRHLLPFDLLAAALVALGASAAQSRWKAARFVTPVVLVGCAVAVPSYEHTQWAHKDVDVARRVRWQWEGMAVGRTLGEAFAREQPLYAVTSAGCLPFASRLPALDLLGLNDRHIARTPGSEHYPLAHDHGDGQYVLQRAPDLVTFGMPRGDRPIFKSGDEMAADPSFARDYTKVRFQVLEPMALTSSTYVRVRGRVGVRPDGQGGLLLPTYLFSGVTGLPLPPGGMGAVLDLQTTARLEVPVEPGTWQAHLEPANARVELRLDAEPGAKQEDAGSPMQRVVLARPAVLHVTLRAPTLSTVVGAVVLEHVADDAPLTAPLLLEASTDANPQPFSLAPGFGAWTVEGEAFGAGSVTAARAGQAAIEAASGPLFDSFRDAMPGHAGDDWTGRLTSPEFVPTARSWVSFRVGGGRAEGADSQVGVRLVERLPGGGRKVHFVATGERDERLRPVRLDLGWLAGRRLVIEVFDEATGGWGHVLADGFTVYDAAVP